MKTELCAFSGFKIYPGHGKRVVKIDGKVFHFINGKCERSQQLKRNPRKINWTVLYRRKMKKNASEETSKKRTRRTQKFQRAITGATLNDIMAKRNQKPEVRKAQREQAIRAAKEKQRAKEQVKKATQKKTGYLLSRRCQSTFTKVWLKKDIDYCIDLVKQHDYETYITTLLLPQEARIPVFGLRALNVEIAKVPDSVTDKNTGKTRLIFWGNCIKSTSQGKPPKTPVASLLSKVLASYKLPEDRLLDLVTAREIHFSSQLPETIADIENYAKNTTSNLLELTLEILGSPNDEAKKMAECVGKAQGLTTMLRAVPFHATCGRILLPKDLFEKYNLSYKEILKGKLTDNGRNLVSEVINLVNQHLEEARSIGKNCDAKFRNAMLPAIKANEIYQMNNNNWTLNDQGLNAQKSSQHLCQELLSGLRENLLDERQSMNYRLKYKSSQEQRKRYQEENLNNPSNEQKRRANPLVLIKRDVIDEYLYHREEFLKGLKKGEVVYMFPETIDSDSVECSHPGRKVSGRVLISDIDFVSNVTLEKTN
ncbi:DgyrCDS12498 [Dimorphilus gyrociliatus]|uniref:Large ribosomal subunit protein eL24 n=1 Tax=Dimorphilus gyrociliatus TaxID=2664684 RepID=A0A7I8W820_9ANNE|nr:DgyrCDS12498 [Dimorphilus gyrociliatus]